MKGIMYAAVFVYMMMMMMTKTMAQNGYNYQPPSSQSYSPPVSSAPSYSPSRPQYSSSPAKYNFQWDVNDSPSGNFYGHQEQRDGALTTGSYYVRLPDTRLMRVEYYADETGYHPTITYEGEAQFPATRPYRPSPSYNAPAPAPSPSYSSPASAQTFPSPPPAVPAPSGLYAPPGRK